MCSQVSNAQLNYSFQQTTEVFTPITGGTILATASGVPAANDSALDSRVYTLTAGTIPFSFYFNGSSYTALSISSNGLLVSNYPYPNLLCDIQITCISPAASS